jgi:CO/xanthine dehydrogenase Mo-binding subunit
MSESRYLGRPARRPEDERYLRGRAIFTDDIALPGALYLALVRVPIHTLKSRTCTGAPRHECRGS